jgi:uncharacterized protein with PIN domain
MTQRQSAKDIGELKKEFVAKAEGAFDEMFGSDGQNGLVAFTQREDRACEATDVLARWLMEKHLELDPAGDPGVKVDCPICGGPVEYGSAGQAEMEIREFQTRRGKVEYQRAARRCPRCRRIFFPHG